MHAGMEQNTFSYIIVGEIWGANMDFFESGGAIASLPPTSNTYVMYTTNLLD